MGDNSHYIISIIPAGYHIAKKYNVQLLKVTVTEGLRVLTVWEVWALGWDREAQPEKLIEPLLRYLQQGSVRFLLNSPLTDRISCQSAGPSCPAAVALMCL